MIIIGIDPGTRVTGYGVIEVNGSSYKALDYGTIRPPVNYELNDRYLIIFEAIEALIEKYHPDEIAVETQFVQKNIQTAIKLGMARGSVIIAAKRKKLPVSEYSPTKVKKAVVGTGKASKQQVQGMIQRLLNLPKIPPEDAADALALAICHAQSHTLRSITTNV